MDINDGSKKIILFISILVLSNLALGQYQGPIPAIESGYGADGTEMIAVKNIPNDHYLLKDISVFYPQGTTTPIPTIFYSHGYGGNDSTFYIESLHHIASKGYAVVFVPYKTIGATIPERYATLFDGFTKAARNLTSIIDTTRVGFYGHSFGGGATPGISYKAFTENNWGTNGKFIFCSAPWYSFESDANALSDFPTDCKMLTVLYDDDITNDHRMGMDVFNNISINDSIKDCVIVYSDTVSGYIYEGDHSLPGQYSPNGEFDALDYYVSFRLLDALADYVFTGNVEAKNIALGNGSPGQIDMGGELTPLNVTDIPTPIYSQSKYQFPCDTVINERRDFCQNILGLDDEFIDGDRILIYPNPTSGILKIDINQPYKKLDISIFTISGEQILKIIDQTEFNINTFPAGTYLLRISMDGIINEHKIIID